jgi:hypothetical protein
MRRRSSDSNGLLLVLILFLLIETSQNHLCSLPDNLLATWEEEQEQGHFHFYGQLFCEARSLNIQSDVMRTHQL